MSAEIVPLRRCSVLGCDKEATGTIRLVDVDTREPSGSKFFCDEHAAEAAAPAINGPRR